MIKHINPGEIDKIKKGFRNCIRLKKLQHMPIEDYKKGKCSFQMAKKIFSLLFNFSDLEIVDCFIKTMLDYLEKFNFIEKSDYEKIIKYFYDESGTLPEEMDYYYDDVDNRIEFLESFLENLYKRADIEYASASFYDIYYDYVDDPIFGELANILQSYAVKCDEDDTELEDYYGLFQDEATSFALLNYEMDTDSLVMLNGALSYGSECGIQSEAFVAGGNTYITISDSAMLDGIGYSFFVALIIILSEKINMKEGKSE